METFKVWLHIEEIDDAGESVGDVDLPEEVCEVDTAEEAHEIVCRLAAIPLAELEDTEEN